MVKATNRISARDIGCQGCVLGGRCGWAERAADSDEGRKPLLVLLKGELFCCRPVVALVANLNGSNVWPGCVSIRFRVLVRVSNPEARDRTHTEYQPLGYAVCVSTPVEAATTREDLPYIECELLT